MNTKINDETEDEMRAVASQITDWRNDEDQGVEAAANLFGVIEEWITEKLK